MFVVLVDILVVPERRDDFVRATRENHVGTRREPSNLRFDVLEAQDDPNRFFLYEVYRDRQGFETHQRTAHYLDWKQAVQPLMARPRVGTRCASLLPEADGDW